MRRHVRSIVAVCVCIALPHATALVATAAPRAAAADLVSLGTLQVSSVGVGMVNLPIDVSDAADASDATDVLRAAAASGVTLVDTAEAYGLGNSERLACSAVRAATARGDTDVARLQIATKFAPAPWRSGPDAVVDACRASTVRLGVERLPLYSIHFPDNGLLPFARAARDEAWWEGLARCHELGLAENVGVCNYGPAALSRAHEALARRGVPLASNQINLSLLFRKQGSLETLARCRELGVRAVAWGPLAQGTLSERRANAPSSESSSALTEQITIYRRMMYDKFRAGDAGGPVRPLLEALRHVAERRGKTVPQVAINWVVSLGAIPIPGARDAAMATENAGAMGWRLTEGEMAELEDAADAVGMENWGFFRLVE